MNELTGNRRFKQMHQVLVLQVEYSIFEKDKWVNRWRDADATDVLVTELA